MKPIHLAISRVAAVWHSQPVTRVLRRIQGRVPIDKTTNARARHGLEAVVVEARVVDSAIHTVDRRVILPEEALRYKWPVA